MGFDDDVVVEENEVPFASADVVVGFCVVARFVARNVVVVVQDAAEEEEERTATRETIRNAVGSENDAAAAAVRLTTDVVVLGLSLPSSKSSSSLSVRRCKSG